MGMRLLNFDYSRPFFYMVTLKRLPHRQALSEIVAPGKCQLSPITRAMVKCIRSFHKACPTIAPIECFSIMPDHIHLLIRITSQSPTSPLRLETIVSLLIQMLEGVSAEITGQPPPLFDTSWHDWIISAQGQLAAFTRYIRENPKRHWLRHENRHFFSHVRSCTFLEREWHAYGNTALLELPIIEGFRCSRKWSPESPEWKTCHIKAERLGPGCAGIGTFMSPCEKSCGNLIYRAGGSLIVLSPEGFSTRWHPTRNQEKLCAQGRLLLLSRWEASNARPDKATLYRRCHELGDLLTHLHS